MDLLSLRGQIDQIDQEMVKLFESRMEISKKVAEYKITTGKPVFDKQRENEKIDSVKSLAHNDFNKHGVEELFEQIMAMSRKLQYQLLVANGSIEDSSFEAIEEINRKHIKVVFQGAEGAYSQAAMNQYFGDDIESKHVDTFRDAMEAIKQNKAQFAVLPIENSSAGIVSEIYDLLVEYDNYIVGEQIIPINHCLLSVKGATIDSIKTVYSHPQSLMQSAGFLREHSTMKQISMLNNAFAARKVAEEGDVTQAAIASEHAANIYGLEILKKAVNDNQSNCTRFIIVTNQKIYRKNAKKISICFEIPHKSGSLYHMLSHFIYNNVNMTKIESRPIAQKEWEYRFFIDFEGNLDNSAVLNVLKGLQEETIELKILGNY